MLEEYNIVIIVISYPSGTMDALLDRKTKNHAHEEQESDFQAHPSYQFMGWIISADRPQGIAPGEGRILQKTSPGKN